MAWSELDSAANAGASGSSGSISVSRTYTGGERAVVWVTAGGTTTISVSDGTNTYTAVGSQVTAGSGDVQQVFECLSCTAGTYTVTATLGTAQAFRGIAVHRFSGLTGSGQLVGQAQTTPGTGADGLSSTNLTPAAQPGMLLGISTDFNGSTVNTGTGFTSSAVYTNVDTANGSYTVSERKNITSTSAVPATFTATSSPSNFVTIAYYAREASNPVITSTDTASPRYNGTLTITGTGFGASQGSGYVAIGSATQVTGYTSWSDTTIVLTYNRRLSNKYGSTNASVQVVDNFLNSSNVYTLTNLLPQTGWDYVDIGTPDTTVANRIVSSPDLASGDQVAYNTVGSTVVVASDGTFSVSGGTTSFDAEVWVPVDGWGATGTQYLSTWNITGTGPRAYTRLGGVFGAGSFDSWLLGTYSGAGVSGTLAVTTANDTLSAAGTTTVIGTLAKTNSNDTLAASGKTTILGTLAKTNANDTLAASGSPIVSGSLAKTNNNDTLSASGSVGSAVSGTLSYTNANDTVVASGTVTVVGLITVTLLNDILSASGYNTVNGSINKTNNNDTLSASGSSGTAVSGTVNYTNINDSLNAQGSPVIIGVLSKTNSNDTSSAQGTIIIQGTLARTNNNDTLAAFGSAGTPSAGIGTKLPMTGVGS